MSLLTSVNGRGLLSARPAAAAANEGYIYSASDASLYRSNGSSWDTIASTGLADQGVITYLDGTVAAAPGTPAAGKLRIYAKTGKVLAVKDDAGTETVLGAAGGGGGAALGAIAYDSTSASIWKTTSSATPSDIDATNAKLDITVPASGAILVMIEGDFSTTVAVGTGRLLVRTGSTDLAARSIPQAVISSGPPPLASNNQSLGGGMWFYITGLTPGALTIKAGFAASGASGSTLNLYAHDGAAGHNGPFVMVAFAA